MHRLLNPIALFVLLVLFGVGIASQRASNAPPEGKGAAADRPRCVIKPGVGIEGLEIGMSRKAAYVFLGYKEREEKTGNDKTFNEFPWNEDNSVSCEFKEGRLSGIRFSFRGNGGWPFDGVTDKGIGRASTVRDVIRKYGEPAWHHVPKDGGGVRRDLFPPVLRYPDLGIMFVFNKEGDLERIWVYAPKQAPKKE